MRCCLVLASALVAAVYAAPVYPVLNLQAAMPTDLQDISDYFNMLASKVQGAKNMAAAPTCDLTRAVMPTVSGLPGPSEGLVLKHVAVGRGTQNYTCDLSNSTAVPAALGAVATLFNASCVASSYPDLLGLLPKVALRFNMSQEDPRLGPSNAVVSGHHFFANLTTPFFNLDTPSLQLGEAPCAKNNSAPAPAGAPRGQQNETAVAWLKLLTRVGATGDLQEVFRVETAGGSPPASCAGMPASFEVQYSAQYWFFEGRKSA